MPLRAFGDDSITLSALIFLSRPFREVEPKVTRTPIDVHAAFPKNVATNQNVIGREVIEYGKVSDELNPILEPN